MMLDVLFIYNGVYRRREMIDDMNDDIQLTLSLQYYGIIVEIYIYIYMLLLLLL